MSIIWYVVVFSLVGGVLSLVGGVLFLSRQSSARVLAKYAAPLAAGALLAASFFDLIPESLRMISVNDSMKWVLGGIVLFFLMEHFLHWFHHHHDHSKKNSAPASLIIVGDSLHNLLDGIAIGAAFLISIPTGVVTAIAVATHEIPQEIGDFGILLKFGYRRRKVLLINFVTAILSTVGAVATYLIGSEADLPIGALLALTAGMFIYISSSDLIPIIHEESRRKAGHIAAGLLILGILVIAGVNQLAHGFLDDGGSSGGHEHGHSHMHEDGHHHH